MAVFGEGSKREGCEEASGVHFCNVGDGRGCSPFEKRHRAVHVTICVLLPCVTFQRVLCYVSVRGFVFFLRF